jgi:hypothetical protein
MTVHKNTWNPAAGTVDISIKNGLTETHTYSGISQAQYDDLIGNHDGTKVILTYDITYNPVTFTYVDCIPYPTGNSDPIKPIHCSQIPFILP